MRISFHAQLKWGQDDLSMIPVMLFTIRLQDRHCTYRMFFSCSSYLQNQIVERADENHGGPLSIVVVFCPPKPCWKEIMVSQSGRIRSAFGCAGEHKFWFPRHYLVKVCVKKPLLWPLVINGDTYTVYGAVVDWLVMVNWFFSFFFCLLFSRHVRWSILVYYLFK